MKFSPLLAVILLSSLACSTLSGEEMRVPLTVRAIDKEKDGCLNHYANLDVAPMESAPEKELKDAPKFQKPFYYQLSAGERDFIAVLDVGDAAKSTLYIENVGVFEGKKEEGDSDFQFGPVLFPDALTPMKVFWRAGSSPPRLKFSPTHCAAGKLQLPDGECTVAFIAKDFSGYFNPTLPAVMALDFERSGRFSCSKNIFKLPKMMILGGTCYWISLAQNGSEAVFQKAEEPSGVLDTECPGMSLVARSDQCLALLLTNDSGQWKLPAGQYDLHTYRLSGKLSNGSREKNASWSKFEITLNKTAIHKMGPPLKLGYVIKPNGPGVVSIDFQLLGKGGETYAPALDREKGEAPRLTIFDEKGTPLAAGKFEFG